MPDESYMQPPSGGRTALAFLLAAILLIGGALVYRSLGQESRDTEGAMSHCFEADFLASMAMETYPTDRIANGKLWQDAQQEYRAALAQTPKMARARRGLAAIEWLQGHRDKAREIVTAPVDVPAERHDTWLATQVAFGAVPPPADYKTFVRYKVLLEREELGWSRFIARVAISSSPQESRRITRQILDGIDAKMQARMTESLLRRLSFLIGLAVLVAFLSFPRAGQLRDMAVPASALVSAFLVGLAMQSLPGLLLGMAFKRFLVSGGDGVYFAFILVNHALGLALSLVCAQFILSRHGAGLSNIGCAAAMAPVWGIGAYLAMVPVQFLAEGISDSALRMFPNVETPVNSAAWMAESAHGLSLFAVFLTVCVLGPLLEELLFRGLLFRGLTNWFGFWGAAILSSAAFAAMHPQLPLGFLPIWVIGVALCILYRRTGSLTACWVLHGVNNTVALLGTLVYSAHLRPF